MKYKYYFTPDHKVICTTIYQGKPIRGVAICADEDQYDEEKGKQIALTKVNIKIGEQKVKSLRKELKFWHELIERNKEHVKQIQEFLNKAIIKLDYEQKQLNSLIDTNEDL